MPKRRKTKTDSSLKNIIIHALMGAAIGTAAFFILTLIVSLICLKRDTDPANYGFIELAAGAASGFVCGFSAAKPVGRKGLIIGALSSLPMYFICILVSVLLTHSGVGAMGWILAGVMLAASAAGGIVAI